MVSHTISKECATIRMAISFLPLFRPFIMSELVSRSMIGHCVFSESLCSISTGRVRDVDGGRGFGCSHWRVAVSDR